MLHDSRVTEVYLKKALYYYDFDLESGILEKDIIGKDGTNYTKRLGLSAPCTFNELMENSYSNNQYSVTQVYRQENVRLSQEYLLEAYRKGDSLVEEIFYLRDQDVYNRVSYYLLPDETTKKPRVYVSCIDITANEKNRETVYDVLCNDKIEIDEIVASAKIGIWYIYLYDGEKPRLKATPTMKMLMGVNDESMSEEEVYDFWYSRIKRSSLPSVQASVAEMIEKGFSENTYTWRHPDKGECIVRCGGTSKKIEGKGIILRGYHSDVTDTVAAETRQKQLLSDALEELRHQKKLLQEALDNYKEADYDRRRDFLTGLRNRQDMFELLQDVLSEKHENIRSMFMMDIDNFKMLNDHYGHTYGDECLQKIGHALNEYGVKNEIYFYRYGGEEMLGISFTDDKKPAVIAQELVDLISGLELRRDDVKPGVVTISLGYTADNQRYEKMIDKADTAMYRAKENGRNQCVCYEDLWGTI